jgi:hypothetical protein
MTFGDLLQNLFSMARKYFNRLAERRFFGPGGSFKVQVFQLDSPQPERRQDQMLNALLPASLAMQNPGRQLAELRSLGCDLEASKRFRITKSSC